MLQVLKDLLDHPRIFDAGNDLHGPAAGRTGLNVDAKDAFQALCPGHGRAAFGRRLVLRLIGRFELATFTPLGGRDQRTVLTVRGDSAEAAMAPPPQQLSIAEQVALSQQGDGPAPTTQGHFVGAATGAAEVEAEEEPEFDVDDVAVSTPEAAPSIMEAIDNPAAAVSSGQKVAMIDVKPDPAPTQEQEIYSPTVNNTFGGMF